MDPLSIMVFTWNTQGVRLAESLDPLHVAHNRTKWGWNFDSHIADFFPDLRSIIITKRPSIVVFGFQEDASPGSYFHSHLLPHEMPLIGYQLVKRTKLMGVGKVTLDAAKELGVRMRGLRTSIYALDALVTSITIEERNLRDIIGNDAQSEYVVTSALTRSKGGVCSYLRVPGYNTIALINCHIPFNAQSLIDSRITQNPILRQNHLSTSNTAYNNILENLALYHPLVKPGHVIYFGDMNYRICDPRESRIVADELLANKDNIEYLRTLYLESDELHQQMVKTNIYHLSEGINDGGPMFIPTCKMSKRRIAKELSNQLFEIDKHLQDTCDHLQDDEDPDVLWKLGKLNQRVPSWTDRILYGKLNDLDTNKLVCTDYSRFDSGATMKLSDHCAVIGMFELTKEVYVTL